MASRSLDDLRSVMQPRAKAWLAACQAAGIEVLVYCTFRSPQEQDDLYARGRYMPGKIVTNARGTPPQSAHNVGLALDFVPLVGGKALWKAPSPEWLEAVEIAKSCGLESGSSWPKLKDWPHLQMPGWKDYATGPLGG
jgi:peptidoglycan L-alanyl-D-glutamate endopeptidase CwlK